MIYPASVTFTSGYSRFERYLLHRGLFKACDLVYEALPEAGPMLEGLKVEFTDTLNDELESAGAIGLAYKDRNLNYCPAGFDRRTFQIYSGVYAMELTHSIIWRLTNSIRICNDLVHWLYNQDYLFTKEWLSALTVLKFGGPAKFLIPDMRYGWAEKDAIMEGIKSGKYKEGPNEYWSDPAFKGITPPAVAATSHDLHHIEDHLYEH